MRGEQAALTVLSNLPTHERARRYVFYKGICRHGGSGVTATFINGLARERIGRRIVHPLILDSDRHSGSVGYFGDQFGIAFADPRLSSEGIGSGRPPHEIGKTITIHIAHVEFILSVKEATLPAMR